MNLEGHYLLVEHWEPVVVYFEYEVESGMDNEMAELVASRFMDTLPDKRNPQFYVSDVYRFLFACFNLDRGQSMPPWLVPDEQATA